MRIALVSPRFYPNIGGIETHVREISRRLSTKGLEVEVLATDPTGKLERTETLDGVRVRRFFSFAPNEAYFLSMQLEHYLKKESNSYDVVHAHSYSAFPSVHAARAKGMNKFVFTPHYHETGHTFLRRMLHVPYRFLGKQAFVKADMTIFVSEYEKRQVLKNFEMDNERIVVIPNGINVNEIRRNRKRWKTGRTILCVGRLEKYKGVQYLIEVLPRLSEDIGLHIVGKGPYRDKLLALTKKVGIANRVIFLQDLTREELLQEYADADLFALLSEHEAYGISVAEALCSGVPCIVANTSALGDWVDGENCFGIDFPINLEKLGILIRNVMRKKIETLKFLDWDEVTNRTMRVYEDALVSHRS